MKKKTTTLIILLLIVIGGFSAFKLIDYYSQSHQNQKNIQNLVDKTDSKAANYKKLKKQNPDLIGWLTIKDTPISYPVMHSKEDGEKYLDTDFDGNYAASGLPFVARETKDKFLTTKPSPSSISNLLVYGHNMKDGSIFASLTKYDNQEFYEKHSIIEFDRIYEDGSYEEFQYQIFSAFKTEIGKGFDFYSYSNIESEEKLAEYLAKVKSLSLIKATKAPTSDPDSNSDSKSNTNTDSNSNSNSETKANADSNSNSETKANADSNSKSKANSNSKSKAKPKLDADSRFKSESNLLTLATCSYHVEGRNGRFVIVAKLI